MSASSDAGRSWAVRALTVLTQLGDNTTSFLDLLDAAGANETDPAEHHGAITALGPPHCMHAVGLQHALGPQQLVARAIQVFDSLHGDLDAMLKDLQKLGKGQRALPTPLHACLGAPDLMRIGADIVREAAATHAAAKRLRMRSTEALSAAASLRLRAWAKASASCLISPTKHLSFRW